MIVKGTMKHYSFSDRDLDNKINIPEKYDVDISDDLYIDQELDDIFALNETMISYFVQD